MINEFSKKFLGICVLIAAISFPVFADTMTFGSGSSTLESLMLTEHASWYPRGLSGAAYLQVGTEDGEAGLKTRRRELLRFDVSALEGQYASIDSVQLYLRYTHNPTGADTNFNISIAQVAAANADWQLLEATWRNKDQDYENGDANPVAWAGGQGLTVAGVDYETPVVGSFMYDYTLQGTGTEIYESLSISTIVDWLENSSSNGGLLLFGGEDIETNAAQFYGLNIPGSAPMLIVNYTAIPEPMTLTMLGFGAVFTLLRKKK